MATQEVKAKAVQAIRESFANASSVVLIDFTGVDVESITDLRSRFRKSGIRYRVAKNTLIKQALKGTEAESNEKFKGHLQGATALAWSYEDPSAAAKVIKAFRKEGEKFEKLTVKCALLDNVVLSSEQVETELASMPGKDELRAKLLATLQAPAQGLVRQMAAAAQNFAYLLSARERSLGEK